VTGTFSTFDAVLFDLDDTLLDGDAAWQSGLARLRVRCPEVELGQARSAWDAAFDLHYPRYLAGELTFDEHRAARLRSWAELVSVTVPDGAELDWFDDYRAGYQAAWSAYADVAPCLAALTGKPLGIITNGHSVQQRDKIAALGLTDTFAAVVASGDIGIAKPDPRIFTYAAEQLGVPADRCVFIGDRRDTDALAAVAVGMRGVWLNRTGATPTPAPTPTPTSADDGVVEITSLAELLERL
jgi:putative hydrolase of the HAD superfamily